MTYRAAQQTDAELRVAEVRFAVRRLFELTQVDGVLDAYPSTEEALA